MEISPDSAPAPCQDLLLPPPPPQPEPLSLPLPLPQKQQHFYDPFYYQRDAGGGRSCSPANSRCYDDFTVYEHLHILRSHSFFLNPTSVSADGHSSPNQAELALPAAASAKH